MQLIGTLPVLRMRKLRSTRVPTSTLPKSMSSQSLRHATHYKHRWERRTHSSVTNARCHAHLRVEVTRAAQLTRCRASARLALRVW